MRCEDWVPEDLWQVLEPLLPPDKPPHSNGRPRVPNRRMVAAMIFVLRTSTPWHGIPREWGFSGKTAWDRFDEWRKLGIWERVQQVVLSRLNAKGRIRWKRALLDSSTVAAPRGAPKRGRIRPIEPNLAASAIS